MRSSAPPTRFRRLLAGAFLLVGAGVGVLLYAVDPAQSRIFPTCVLRELTGWQCPGCGSLRAVHVGLQGRVGEALRLSPLGAVALPLLTVLALNELRVAGGRSSWSLDPRLGRVVWVVPVLLLLYTVLRNTVWRTLG